MATLTWLLDVNAPNAAKTFDQISARVKELDANLKRTREVVVGDRQAMATFSKLQLQADRFGDRIHNMPLTLEGAARAEAQLLGLEATADRLNSKLGRSGFASWLTAGIPSLIQSFGNLGTGFTGFISSMAATGPIGIGVLAAITAAAAVLVAMLSTVAAALIPITIGFVGFAALAIPTITSVWTAVSKGGAAWKALTPAQKQVGDQLKSLKDEFGKLSKAIQPEVLTAFSEALKIVKDLMPALRPLVIAAGKAIDAFLKSMDNWLKSPSGQAFIKWLKTDGPRDIKTFGKILWDTAVFIGVAFDHIYRTGVWLEGHLHTLFTDQIPAAFHLFVDAVKFDWFTIELATLQMALSITTTMGHLPGPLGAPFRKASADIRVSLQNIQNDVANAVVDIHNKFDELHGKTLQVKVGLDLPAGISSHDITGIHGGLAAGTSGAAPGWWWVGERGPELVRMRGGETVIPNHMIGGYAQGVLNFSDRMPSAGRIAGILQIQGLINAVAALIQRTAHFTGHLAGGLGGVSGPGGGAPSANAALAHALYASQLTPASWAAWNYVAMRESGWSQFARNQSSGAYGIAQALPPTKYPFAGQAAGGSNPMAQITWMWNYMRSVYGGPLGAEAHELAFNWYDRGGYLPTGLSLALNTTGRPEPVGGGNITVNVHVTPLASPAETGRKVAEVLAAYKKNGGMIYRPGGF